MRTTTTTTTTTTNLQQHHGNNNPNNDNNNNNHNIIQHFHSSSTKPSFHHSKKQTTTSRINNISKTTSIPITILTFVPLFLPTIFAFRHSSSFFFYRGISTSYGRRRLSMSSSSSSSSDDMLSKLSQRIISHPTTTSTPLQTTFAIAGGGSTSLSSLTSTSHASRILVAGHVLYSQSSTLRFLNQYHLSKQPELKSFVGSDMARRLAKGAWIQSVSSSSSWNVATIRNCVGVGCTSSLTSEGERPDRIHRCCLEVQNGFGYSNGYHGILRSTLSRREQEEAVSSLVLYSLLDYQCRSQPEKDDDEEEEEWMERTFRQINSHFESLTPCDETIDPTVEYGVNQMVGSPSEEAVLLLPTATGMTSLSSTILPNASLLLPGSFNPIHEGHVRLAEAAVKQLPRQNVILLFEISIINADKPPLQMDDILHRLKGIQQIMNSKEYDWGVVLTSKPLFVQKVEMLSRCSMVGNDEERNMTFAIGTDTMIRILDPKYYRDDREEMMMAMTRIQNKGVHFVVGGRLEQRKGDDDGSGTTFINGQNELNALPKHLQTMFTLLSEEDFRVDVSSTELRKRAAAAATAEETK